MTSYDKLKQIFHEAALSSDIAGILHWDMSTMMPKNSRENRAEQLAYLSKIRHQLISSPKVGKLIAERAIEKGVNKVAFDRSGYKFHGRVKALAESAREAGLSF